MLVGLYAAIAKPNLAKKVLGLGIFQTGIFVFYISLGFKFGATAPVVTGDPETVYANPLPHVLILTAIVVSVSTMAVALSLIVLIKRAYGTTEADEIAALEVEDEP
ncbi:MAG: cation:proton antiporter [Planctomycetota bacterium]|nr:MAG: cation:proton antiporter [Planctomycetota bacterium]